MPPRHHPVDVSSGTAFRGWICSVHNVVNRSIGKPEFNCALAAAVGCDLKGGVGRRK